MKFLSAFALVTAASLATVARADTFTFTAADGRQVMFSGTTPDSTRTDPPYNYAQYNVPGGGSAYFYAESESDYLMSNGFGHVDFEYDTVSQPYAYLGLHYVLDGPTLFTGSVSSPNFIPGTYNLVGDPAYGQGVSGTLVIAADAAVTPEPSSLALLGTGVLGVFGVARRRFLTA